MAEKSPSELIDERIAELADWRGQVLARVRAVAHAAVPDLHEDWKWRGVPTFESDGLIFTGETYKTVVKLTFAKGAALPDPQGLFNASLEGKVRRAIDIAATQEDVEILRVACDAREVLQRERTADDEGHSSSNQNTKYVLVKSPRDGLHHSTSAEWLMRSRGVGNHVHADRFTDRSRSSAYLGTSPERALLRSFA